MLVTVLPLRALADEGMFLPDAVATLPLAKRGMKIKPIDVYNPNGISLKDAIVIVDGGTGEFVSADGLLLTNHHVAFAGLVGASTAEKNLGELGYRANSRAEELPIKNYQVTITQEIKDVTAEIKAGTETMTPEAKAQAIATRIGDIQKAGTKREDGIRVAVTPLNEGMFYYKFTYYILRDVRIAYAPPKNIGFYGGDPDNFEWPRHCGDFTFMRAYTGPDGKPADYATSNIPYKPKKWLTISLDGVRENDFVMVMGYPGSTRRYREGYSVAYNQDIGLPFQVDYLTEQIRIREEVGKYNPDLRIQLQSAIFGIANTKKALEGGIVAMRHSNLVQRKRDEETRFETWLAADVARKAKYGDALPSLKQAYDVWNSEGGRSQVVQTLSGASVPLELASIAAQYAADREKPETQRDAGLARAVAVVKMRAGEILGNRNLTIERGELHYLLRQAAELPEGQRFDFIESTFAGKTGEARTEAEEAFARSMVENKDYNTGDKVLKLFDLTVAQMRAKNDPLLNFALGLGSAVAEAQKRSTTFNAAVARWRPVYVAGMAEMRGGKPYPDANRTLRFTYGSVKGYVPKEAITASAFTTLSGVLEKDTGREPFNAPPKLRDLERARDFGRYAPKGGDIPVDFLATTDIIGGNSGSPIMNANGEQVGIVFDGNFEGLGDDFFYDEPRNRTISVDIRYVLFLTDKFGGAGWILNELKLKGKK
jgi:hypothetical protein